MTIRTAQITKGIEKTKKTEVVPIEDNEIHSEGAQIKKLDDFLEISEYFMMAIGPIFRTEKHFVRIDDTTQLTIPFTEVQLKIRIQQHKTNL